MRKKRRQETVPTIPVMPIAAGLVAFVIIFHFLLISINYIKNGTLKRLEKKWTEMQPQKKATDKIAQETTELEKRVNAVKKIAKPELNWTRLLSGLNQAIIPGIWLSSMNLDYKGKPYNPKNPSDHPTKLVLVGYAEGKSEVATTSVARFINSLKRNQDFFGYFDEVELENMRSQAVSGEETMFFRLSCDFKKKAAAPIKTPKDQDKKKAAGK